MKKANNIVLGCIGVLVLIIGFSLGKIINVPGITIDKSINPVHLISVLIPLLMAFAITFLLGQRREKISVAKSLLIEKVSRVESSLDRVLDQAISNQLEISSAAHAVKKAEASINQIYSALDTNNLMVETTIQTVHVQMHRFKCCLTDTPRKDQGAAAQDVKVVDGVAQYSVRRISKIDSALDSVNSTLLQLQLEINRN